MTIESIEGLKKQFEEVRKKQSILESVLFLLIFVPFVSFFIARFYLGDGLLFRPDVLLFSLNLFLVYFFVVFVLIIFLLIFNFKSRSIGKEVADIIKQTYHIEKMILFPKIELTGEGDFKVLLAKIKQFFVSLELSKIQVDKNERIVTAYKNLSSTGFLSRINFFLFLLRRTLIQRISVTVIETSSDLFKLEISVGGPFLGFNYYLLKQIEAEILKEIIAYRILSSSGPLWDDKARKSFVRQSWFILLIFLVLPLIWGIYQSQKVACGKEGQIIGIAGSPDTCCKGLKGLWSNDDDNCNSPSIGGLQVCSHCGNGTCEQKNRENRCNCPEDCR